MLNKACLQAVDKEESLAAKCIGPAFIKYNKHTSEKIPRPR